MMYMKISNLNTIKNKMSSFIFFKKRTIPKQCAHMEYF